MAHDSQADRFVLFGGWDGYQGLNGTWVFDPVNRTWTELHLAVSPAPRGDEMFVYDERASVFLLFGGWYEFPNETYVRLSDTWIFSLSTHAWTERHPPVSPSPRSDAEVAYDPVVDQVLLVGGFSGTGYLGDVWSYSLANDTWSPRPSFLEPSPRSDGRMVYVPSQDRFILYGGNDYNGPNFTFHHLADTWAYGWATNTWTRVPTSVAPPARDYPILADGPNSLLLTSGYGNRTILGDLWAFDLANDTWSNLTPAKSPPPRYAGAGGFDAAEGVFVVFSGAGDQGLLADTWFYETGVPQTPNPPGPPVVPLVLIAAAAIVGVLAMWAARRRRRGGPTGKPGARGASPGGRTKEAPPQPDRK